MGILFHGTPRGSQIPVASLKERCPNPLDDRGRQFSSHNMRVPRKLSIVLTELLIIFLLVSYPYYSFIHKLLYLLQNKESTQRGFARIYQ